MIYIIYALGTRRNESLDEQPRLASDGYNENIEAALIAVYTDKDKAIEGVNKIVEHCKQDEKVTQKMWRNGEGVTAEVISTCTDESGNEWITQFKLESIYDDELNKGFSISDLYLHI